MKDSRKLMIIGTTLLIATGLFLATADLVFQTIKPPAPACKICHCGKVSCDQECGEEAMCMAVCEGRCQKR